MKGVDKHVDCTSKTRTVIGRFPIVRTVSGYENQILIGQIRERNVVRKKAAVSGEERCVTSLKTAAKETSNMAAILQKRLTETQSLGLLCTSLILDIHATII